MNEIIPTTVQPITTTTNRQAASDDQVIALWLHGRSPATQRAYRADASRMLAFTARTLHAVTLGDLQAFADSLTALSPASQARTLAAVKSLICFAHELGYLQFDVAKPLKLPKLKDTLAERIISERAVLKLIGERHAGETTQQRRDRLIVTVLYVAGLRISELCGLRWRDAAEREDGGQITVFGKGGKTRFVRLPASVWAELVELRGNALPDDPIFVSREGGALDQSQVNRRVHALAKLANLSDALSPHWLRHCHASHALDRGCAPHIVQQTLGHASLSTTSRYTHVRPGESSGRYLAL